MKRFTQVLSILKETIIIGLVTITLNSTVFAGKFDSEIISKKSPSKIHDISFIKRVFHFDPLKGESQFPYAGAGSFRTAYGTQFGQSCMRMIKTLGINTDEVKILLEQFIEDIFRVIVDNCATKYPQLKDAYLKEFVTQARRTLINCEESRDNSSAANNDFFSRFKRSWIVITPATLSKILTKNKERDFRKLAIEIMIHEFFHSTHANNQTWQLHNDKINRPFNKQSPCLYSIADDRVEMLSMLCTEQTDEYLVNSPSYLTAQQMVAMRSDEASCGLKRGCINLMTNKMPFLATLMSGKSQGLPYNQARSFCEKLYDEGHCQLKRPQFSFYNLLRKSDIFDKLISKTKSFFVFNGRQIPAPILNLQPEFKKELALWRALSCGEEVLKIRNDGSMEVFPFNALYGDIQFQNNKIDNFEKDKSLYDLDPRVLDNLGEEVVSAFLGHPSCRDKISEKMALRMKNLAASVSALYFNILSSNLFKNNLMPLYNNDVARLQDLEAFKAIPFLNSEDEFFVEKILGADLLNLYREKLMSYHPLSPKFDCKKAGLFPYSESLSQ